MVSKQESKYLANYRSNTTDTFTKQPFTPANPAMPFHFCITVHKLDFERFQRDLKAHQKINQNVIAELIFSAIPLNGKEIVLHTAAIDCSKDIPDQLHFDDNGKVLYHHCSIA